ncbi:hypothetical protein TWF730_006034 [Orbilia blumenaviensis]|uniref:Uncharacterized protein n=1 Tax=Orbilia blumenaviensis TaxID=1796055 RepID=A0AAV9VMC2_9PEZI
MWWRSNIALVLLCAWLPLLSGVLAPNRAAGCGDVPATIGRREFDNFFKAEQENIQVLAAAIEEIDYLQEEGMCPSNLDYINVFHRDPSFHVQPLINKLFDARIQIGQLVQESVEDEAEGYGTFFDEADLGLIHKTIYNLEIRANAEKDAVDGFLADIDNLARLRYPDITERKVNLVNLAMQIDDGHPDGPFLVEYTVGARENLQERFDNLVERMELAISDYDRELEVHDIVDRGQLDEWFPKGSTYQDVIGALIRWSSCWLEGVGAAAEALRAIGPAPKPDDPRPARWGAFGRGLSTIGRSLSSIGRGDRGGRGRSDKC